MAKYLYCPKKLLQKVMFFKFRKMEVLTFKANVKSVICIGKRNLARQRKCQMIRITSIKSTNNWCINHHYSITLCENIIYSTVLYNYLNFYILFILVNILWGARIAQSVLGYDLDDWGSVPSVHKDGIFFFSPSFPGWLWGPPNLLYNGYQWFFPCR